MSADRVGVPLRPSASTIPTHPPTLFTFATTTKTTQSAFALRALEGASSATASTGFFRNVPDPSRSPETTFVIVPGSAQVKVGRAGDAFPTIHPQVIAIRRKRSKDNATDEAKNGDKHLSSRLSDREWRQKLAVRLAAIDAPITADAYLEEMRGVNAALAQSIESVALHNDLNAVEWITKAPASQTRFYGQKVIALLSTTSTFILLGSVHR